MRIVTVSDDIPLNVLDYKVWESFSTASVLLAGNYFSQHWLYFNVTMAVPGDFLSLHLS